MVWASCNDAGKARHALVEPPNFAVAPAHATIQKGYRGSSAGIRDPDPAIVPLLAYVDRLREDLAIASEAYESGKGRAPRLTLSGVVARLLAFPQYRGVGFTPALFREALFTQLLEANIAPTRRSQSSLDRPLAPSLNAAGKVVWPTEMWSFLNLFGALIQETDLDDIEDDAFADNAIALLTFHQTKGLEFDHVYIGATGRQPNPHAVLQTMLFSGDQVKYHVDPTGQPECSSRKVRLLAEADREREVYVALSRARRHLTILHDPNDERPLCSLNPALKELFAHVPAKTLGNDIIERRWKP